MRVLIFTVLTRVARRAVLHDKVDIGHIDTASGNIRRNQNLESLCAERLDGQVTLVLGDVSVEYLSKLQQGPSLHVSNG